MSLFTNTAVFGSGQGQDPEGVGAFSPTGVVNGTIAIPANVSGAGAIAVSVADDRIYAQSQGIYPVECLISFYDGAGTLKAQVIPDNQAYAIHVPAPGTVWIANTPLAGPGTVDEYDPDGTHLRLVATLTCADGGGAISVGGGMAKRGNFLYFVAIRDVDAFGGIFRYDLVNAGDCVQIVPFNPFNDAYAASFALTPGGQLLLHGSTDAGRNLDGVWRYDLAGALQALYTAPTTPVHFQGLAADPDDLHFWTGSLNGIARVTMATGAWTEFNSYEDPPGSWLSAALAVPESIVPRPREAIRFVRVFPHLSDEQFQVFCSRLEFECQRGVGTISGQGENPQALLSVSRDGGMTFGPERMLTMGKIGEYLTRCYTTRLGRSRDFVFKLVVTDPVLVAFMGCLVDLDGGTS